jgi:GTP-binding protein HflX
VSASTGSGIELLLQIVTELTRKNIVELQLLLPVSAGRIRAEFYRLHAVVGDEYTDSGENLLSVRMPEADFNQLNKRNCNVLDNYILRDE